MPDVVSLMEADSRFVRKWGNKLLAVAPYSAPMPETWFDADGLPNPLPDYFRQVGFITSDGIQLANSISSSSVTADQQIDAVRSDIESLERTLVVTFLESNAWTKALYYGTPLADWPATPYTPSSFHDGDFVDFPYMRLVVIASDGVGDQAFYRVEGGYRAKVTNVGNRQLQRTTPETRNFTFGLFRDPITCRAVFEAEDGPGFSNLIPPTGVTAGTPGAFTPAGAYPPANLAALESSGIVPSPATAWTEGQYVVLGDGSHAYWDGDSWAEGEAPA